MQNKIFANFVARGFEQNIIFDLSHPWNRDNCFYPYYLMRERLKQLGIELNTSDVNRGESTLFDLHMNAQECCDSKYCYLLMLETPQVWPSNGVVLKTNRYRKIFTWNDDLVDGDRFVKINFPNLIHAPIPDGYVNRNRFCCLISTNRALDSDDQRILYPARVQVIRWFETHAPEDLDLYGVDWDLPQAHGGWIGRIERRIWRHLRKIVKPKPFPSYQGTVTHKKDVMLHTRFAICYENVRDLPGYITEKIFDCFFSGCVPVYWGANNVTNYIPSDCFVDRRKFLDIEELYSFLKAMTEEEFKGYQQRIAAFLQSEAAYPFSSEYFERTIVSTIVKDLGL